MRFGLTNLKSYIKQHGEVAVVFLFGLVLTLVGAILWPYFLRPSTILVSIGASLIAASVVTYLSPATQEVYQRFLKLGISDVYLSRKEIRNEQWVEWMKTARRQFTQLGIANNNWCRDPDFKPALLDLVRRERTVKFFLLDPTSEVAKQRAKEEHSATARDTIQTIRESLKFLWDLREEIDEAYRENLKIYVYNGTPSFGVTWVDTFMVATHYLAGFANVTSPCVMIKPVESTSGSRDLYGIYDENLRNIEKHYAIEINQDNIANYVPPQPAQPADEH